jgi:hypothetical protein
MPNFTDLTGLAGIATAMTAACMWVPAIARLARPYLAAVLALVFVLVQLPLNGLPLAGYLRGEIGDLSITTLVLLAGVLIKPWGTAASPGDRPALQLMIALAALLLYPMALGLGAYDPYRLGFGDPLFAAAWLILALGAWYWRYTTIALCIALCVLAWVLGWYESGNLWDYLLDPFVAIYALSALLRRGVQSLWRVIFHRAYG